MSREGSCRAPAWKLPIGYTPERGSIGIQAFLGMLENVKEQRDQWIAKCKACNHVSNRPTLVVGLRDNRILLHCYRGCRAIDVVHSMGLKLSDLFDDREPTDPVKRREWRATNTMAHKMAAMNALLNETDRVRMELAICSTAAEKDAALAAHADAMARTLADVGEL